MLSKYVDNLTHKKAQKGKILNYLTKRLKEAKFSIFGHQKKTKWQP